ETAQDFRLMGDARRRIAGVDEQRLDRRIVDFEQPLTESLHVQRARFPGAEVIAREGRPVQAKEASCIVEDAAARVPPVAGHARKPGNRSHRHPAAAVTLKADADANTRRPPAGQLLAQFDNRFSRKPRNRGRARWRKVEDPPAKRLPADGVLADELLILLAL